MDQNHPLWATWKNYCKLGGRYIVQEWLVFDAFLRGVGDKPGPEFRLTRKNPGAKIGPSNFHWKKKRTGSTKKWRSNSGQHPLYQRWLGFRRAKNGLCREWADDFYAFVAAVGDPPDKWHHLKRNDVYSPLGPGNFSWKYVKPDAVTADKRAYRAQYMREYMANNRDVAMRAKLKKLYGIELEDYNSMMTKQRGVCAICSSPETRVIRGKPISLAVDHCHATHKIRGLLCSDCNRGIGHFADDPQRLRNAAEYLERTKEK